MTVPTTCTNFRHICNSHFTCATFYSHFLIAGDIGGFIHVFNLRTMRHTCLMNVSDGRAVFSSSSSPTLNTSLVKLEELPTTPHGVLNLGLEEISIATSSTSSSSSTTKNKKEKKKITRRMLWIHLRSLQVAIFDADDLLFPENKLLLQLKQQNKSVEEESEEEEDDDEEKEESDDEDEQEQPIETATHILAQGYLQPLHCFSFAPTICLSNQFLFASSSSSTSSSSVIFLCPNEIDVPVFSSGNDEQQQQQQQPIINDTKTIPSLQYFIVSPHNEQVPFTVRDNGVLHLVSTSSSSSSSDSANSASVGQEFILKAQGLGQIMTQIEIFKQQRQQQNLKFNEKEEMMSSSSSSSSCSSAFVAVGVEGGFVIFLEIFANSKESDFSGKRIQTTSNNNNNNTSSNNMKCRVACEPVMSLVELNYYETTTRSTTKSQNHKTSFVLAGSAEGTVCCIQVDLSSSSDCCSCTPIWTKRVNAGVGNMLLLSNNNRCNRLTSKVFIFLWNGETSVFELIHNNDDVTHSDEKENENETSDSSSATQQQTQKTTLQISSVSSSSSSSSSLRPEGGGNVSGITQNICNDKNIVRLVKSFQGSSASSMRMKSQQKKKAVADQQQQVEEQEGIIAIAGKNGSLSLVLL